MKIAELEKEIESLKEALQEKDKVLSFLSKEQVESIGKPKTSISSWSNASVIKALKLRFAVGKHGFNYLRQTGYPLPSYSTLNRRIQNLNFNFGLLNALFPILKTKIAAMDEEDKNCCLLIDEMEISNLQDFDVSTKSFVGNSTLGSSGVANHYMVIMLRGLKSPWKQIVAHELTGHSTTGPDMKKVISETIDAARNIGLKVRASTSDMGPSNKAAWSSLGVCVSRNVRQTSYHLGVEEVHTVADVPHLIKNMRKAFLTHILILPQTVCVDHDLPSVQVSSGFLKELWISEISSDSTLRSLHHLNRCHLFPTHFTSMNVATAVQLFSIKTAAAIEKAVSLKQVAKEALTTAWWIRFIAQWFEIMTARQRKQAITKRNQEKKIKFLLFFVDTIQETQLGKGWKPLQTGMILSTLSVINITKELFLEGFSFFLPGRLTQDALENVFGQIRRKSGSKPSALQARVALKLICISQFISDIKYSSYASVSDHHLLDTAALNKSLSSAAKDPAHSSFTCSTPLNPSASSQQNPLVIAAQENDIFYIAGATLNAVLKMKRICESCRTAIVEAEDSNEPDVPKYRTLLTEYCDLGGLKKPESGMYRICREAERAFKNNKQDLLTDQICINDDFIKNIVDKCANVSLPLCCKLKETIIQHYLVIRCKGLQKYLNNKRAHEASYGSASANKKQKRE